jgi:hypothetical protein
MVLLPSDSSRHAPRDEAGVTFNGMERVGTGHRRISCCELHHAERDGYYVRITRCDESLLLPFLPPNGLGRPLYVQSQNRWTRVLAGILGG